MPTPDQDAELLNSWCQGDRAAADALIERNFPRIKRFFAQKTSDRDLIQELTQRTFIRCMDKVHAFESRASFSSFLYGIARFILLEHYRERRKYGHDIPIEDMPVEDLDPSPFSLIERKSERKLIIHILRRLPLRSQILVELYFFEDLPARQVAEVLQLPEGTVRGRIRACRKEIGQHVHDLAQSPEQLESTLLTLDRWAQQVRDKI